MQPAFECVPSIMIFSREGIEEARLAESRDIARLIPENPPLLPNIRVYFDFWTAEEINGEIPHNDERAVEQSE